MPTQVAIEGIDMQVSVNDAKALGELYERISSALKQAETINIPAVASLGQAASDAFGMLTSLAPLVQKAAQFSTLISQAQDELTRQRAANAAEQAQHQAAVEEMQREVHNARMTP
jgi:hypothetical protein